MAPKTPTAEQGTDVTLASQTQLAAFSDDEFFGMETGLENVTSDDVTLPRYTILQGLSPQVNPRKDEYVEGAKMGMILNTASNKVMDSVHLVFAAYQRRHIEWTPRDKPCPVPGLPQVTGGGLYRDYGTDDSILSQCKLWEENNSLWTPRGNELVITGTWYAIDVTTLSTVFLAMGKTQLTSSKKLLAGIRDEKVVTSKGIVPAPLFYRAWELSTKIRQNGENEWFVWNHKPSARIQEMEHGRAILDMVKEINRTIAEGEMTIDVAVGETDGAVGGGSAQGENARM